MREFEAELEEIRQICDGERYQWETERVRERCSGRPLILYGAGAIGVSVERILRRYHVQAACFCDKNKSGIQADTGLPVISPRQMADQYPDSNIIVCSVNYKDEIIQELRALGIDPQRILLRGTLHLHEMAYDDILPHLEGYRETFNLLGDEQSKRILMDRIKCYLTSFPITYSPPGHQYFDPEIISLNEKEIFVDGGMYTGDTAVAFFRFVRNRYRHYYGFEPDEQNFSAARCNLQNKRDLTLVPKGLWSTEREFSFNGNLSSGSRLDANAVGSSVEVIALDTFFRNKEEPTFIKMDIEGAELEALKGAERLIRQYRPKLAICAYHKPEDLYTLPELIKRFRDDYTLYLRHYTDTIYETVLYAV